MIRLNLLLLLLVMLSAGSVVTSQYKVRRLYSELDKEKQVQQKMRDDWDRLLLEQGAHSRQAMVAEVATTKIGMVMPEPARVRVIPAAVHAEPVVEHAP